MKKIIAVLGFLAALALAAPAMAQSLAPTYTTTSGYTTAYTAPTSYCPALSYNLYFGVRDYYTRGQVTALQQFLSARGYYQPVTGYFGGITRNNVAQFQRQYNIYPVTGGVGPITRGVIGQLCQGGGSAGGLSITGVSGPNTLGVGQQGTWSITTNAPYGSNLSVSVRWGDEGYYPYGTSSAGAYASTQTSFSHTYQQAGTYTITFTVSDSYGHSTTATQSVVVGGQVTQQAPVITSVTPTQGPVGTTVTIQGYGFTDSNVIHFGNGGKMSVPSFNNGTLMYYTIPSTVSGCDVIMTFAVCAQYVQQVTPGTYSLYVANQYGQSQATNFTVTGSSNCYPYSTCPIGGVTVSSPSQGQTYSRGQDMTISWGYPVTPNSTQMMLELYTAAGTRVGLIAVSSNTSGSYTWHIPGFPQNYMCTLQYPNGLCGTSIPDGQYYVKVSASNNPLDSNPSIIASGQSGTFTMTGAGGSTGSISANPQSGNVPLTTTFTVNNYSGSYFVNYGDGTSASLVSGSTSHTYYNRGTYTATFTSDYACLHSTPACQIAQQNLGSVTVTVN